MFRLMVFFISQSPGCLDPVFQSFQIKSEAKNNPLYTVYQSFIFSPFVNTVLTLLRGPRSLLNLLNKLQCSPLALKQAFYSRALPWGLASPRPPPFILVLERQ